MVRTTLTLQPKYELEEIQKFSRHILSTLIQEFEGGLTFKKEIVLVRKVITNMENEQSVISVSEYVNQHKTRVPSLYHKMIVECWSNHYIGPILKSCGLVIFKDPKLQQFTGFQSCYFITTIDSSNTRTLLFTYDNGINCIASFKWDHRNNSHFITLEDFPENILAIFSHKVHEQLFGIGWSAITAVPQAAPANYQPSEDTLDEKWILRD